MHEINLLPPLLRIQRSRRVYVGRVARLLFRVCLLLAVVVAIQAVGLGVFTSILREVESRARVNEASPLESVTRDVANANAVLAAFRQRVDTHVPWTGRLEDVFAALSAPVVITGLGAEADLQQLTVSGTSDSRSVVTTLREDLTQLPWVASVDVPLDNFTVSQEAEFTLHLTVK
jgi:hypothetical protein